jgi:hypothetical protein
VGELSRVLSVLDRDGNISFAVVTADGRVLERYYGDVCTSSAKGPNCARREKHGERRASGRERELAQVRIGDLDPGVVGRLRRASGSGRQVPVGLRRRQWALVPTGGAPYVADADGGRLHRAVSAAERALARAVAEDSGLR